MKSGLWSLFRQKPFSKVPNSDSIPESFYISAMPTEPFAINCNFLFSNVDNYIQHGINILKEIFNCEIHFSSNKDSAFKSLDNVNHYTFNELHPAGNIGIQIHHINPIKDSRDTRWYLSMQDLNNIGFYFKKNKYPNFKYFSVGGNGVSKPGYYKTLLGTPINDMLKINENNTRLISGDVLSGNETTEDFSLDYYDDILSAINTSSARQFIGWLLPGLRKYSLTNVFLSKLIRNKKSTLNTNLNGSLRTIISMGNWDSVLPMNIYSEFLVKSILAKDIDMMEKLGILEVSPEDLSLCSFICQSKTEVSKIIEDGLNLIQEEI
jgi:Na+-transporting NADH:ubiquinone oxidoreductase subunit A